LPPQENKREGEKEGREVSFSLELESMSQIPITVGCFIRRDHYTTFTPPLFPSLPPSVPKPYLELSLKPAMVLTTLVKAGLPALQFGHLGKREEKRERGREGGVSEW